VDLPVSQSSSDLETDIMETRKIGLKRPSAGNDTRSLNKPTLIRNRFKVLETENVDLGEDTTKRVSKK